MGVVVWLPVERLTVEFLAFATAAFRLSGRGTPYLRYALARAMGPLGTRCGLRTCGTENEPELPTLREGSTLAKPPAASAAVKRTGRAGMMKIS